jgi:DNA-binding IclR family transcriptional regulator
MTTKHSPKERKFVTALARGLDVLKCFGAGDRYLGNSQIAERTGLAKSTVSRISYTLTQEGFLEYVPEQNKYRLTAAVLSLGYVSLAQMDVRRIARPLMQALAEHTGASVNFGVRDRLNMVYIDTYRNASTYAVQLNVGSEICISTTSMGRAYLAALAKEKREELMEEIRLSREGDWRRIEQGIKQAVIDYRDKGYCLSLGDWRPESHAVAVPLVPEDDGTDIMVFSCSGAAFQLTPRVVEEDIGPRLLNLVANVKTALIFT